MKRKDHTLVEPKPLTPIIAIMDSSSAVVASISSPSSTGVSGSRFGLEEVGAGASSVTPMSVHQQRNRKRLTLQRLCPNSELDVRTSLFWTFGFTVPRKFLGADVLIPGSNLFRSVLVTPLIRSFGFSFALPIIFSIVSAVITITVVVITSVVSS